MIPCAGDFIEFPMAGAHSSPDVKVFRGNESIYLGLPITKADGGIIQDGNIPDDTNRFVGLKSDSNN